MGMKIIRTCDFCKKEIKLKEVTIMGCKRKIYDNGIIKCPPFYNDYDLGNLGISICKECASELSVQLFLYKSKIEGLKIYD